MRPQRVQKLKCDWDTFYWSDEFKSRDNETLRQCFHTYGVGGWMSSSKDMVAALIFLDSTRSPCNSWLLGVKHFHSNKQEASSCIKTTTRRTFRRIRCWEKRFARHCVCQSLILFSGEFDENGLPPGEKAPTPACQEPF